jgi:hypothetical protein
VVTQGIVERLAMQAGTFVVSAVAIRLLLMQIAPSVVQLRLVE